MLNSSSGFRQHGMTWAVAGLLIVLAAFLLRWTISVVYNIFLHPLRGYPGPLLWRSTRLAYDVHVWRGTMHSKIRALHAAYGPVVRVTPKDLSFASAEAMHDILAHITGQEEFRKDAGRRTRAPNGATSILGADQETHARYRKLLAHAFSEKGMREQEPLIMQYVDLLITRLSEFVKSGEPADLVVWYNRTTFDVIGDLAFGDPFDGLKMRTTHPWIPHLYNNVKYVAQIAAIRPWIPEYVANKLITEEVRKGRQESFQYAQNKITHRIEYGRDRGDFWDGIISKGADHTNDDGMTKPEMVNNASALVLAGSETTASILSAATYLILKHPQVLSKAIAEVRSAFTHATDISLLSVSKLPYMLAVFNEAQRIYPALPQVFPRTPPRGGGMVAKKWIPEGMGTIVHLLAAFHLNSNFHRPNEFLPERWLEQAKYTGEFVDDNRDIFQPFSIGPRSCLGRNLATSEMRLIMAKLLFHFDLTLDQSTGDWLDQKAWGLWSKKPLYVKLTSFQ